MLIPAETWRPAADDIASDNVRQSLRIRGRSYLKRFRTLSCSGPRFEFSSTIHVDKSLGP
jgi:hypothetical protein